MFQTVQAALSEIVIEFHIERHGKLSNLFRGPSVIAPNDKLATAT
jgi:hypothetical protein